MSDQDRSDLQKAEDAVRGAFNAVETAADYIVSRWGLCPYDCNLPCQQPTDDDRAKELEKEAERGSLLCAHLRRALEALSVLKQVEEHADHYSGECVNCSLQAQRYLKRASSAVDAMNIMPMRDKKLQAGGKQQ